MRPAMSLWRWLGTPMFARHCPILFQDGFHRPDQNPWTGDDNWDVLSGTWKIDNHRLQLVTAGASHSIVKCLRPVARPFVLIVPIKDNSGYVCVNFEDPSNYNYVRWWWSSSTSLYTSVGEVVGGIATGFSSSVDGSCSGNETRETELYVCVTEHGVSASAVCVPQAWRLKQGVLTTRTSDTEGVITLGSSHGFSNDYVDVRWTGGSRIQAFGSTGSTTITISGGTGDNLPAVGTAVTVEMSKSYYRPLYKPMAAAPFYRRSWVSDYFALYSNTYQPYRSISAVKLGTTGTPECPVCSMTETSFPNRYGGCWYVPVLFDVTIPVPVNGTCGAACQQYAGEHVLHARSGYGWTKWLGNVCGGTQSRIDLLLTGTEVYLYLYMPDAYCYWKASYTMPSPCTTWEDWPEIDMDVPYFGGDYSICDFRGTTAHIRSRPFREAA